MATIFYTPPGYSGKAQLTASTGLQVIDQGLWQFSKGGYNDQISFGLSLTYPSPDSGGELHLRAQNWSIPVIGNELTSYYNPATGDTYPASQCRILITGTWSVMRRQNSNSYVSFGILYDAWTYTDLGDRPSNPNLLNLNTYSASYVIQGVDVTGGAMDTFSSHVFYCRATEKATSENSNKLFQSNTIITPSWNFSYSKSWEIDV